MSLLQITSPIDASTYDVQLPVYKKQLPDDAQIMMTELASIAPLYNLDPKVPQAMFLVETDDGTSDYWDQGNPAGIGITYSGQANPFGFPSIHNSAMVLCEMLYQILHKQESKYFGNLTLEQQAWLRSVWYPKVTSPNFPDVIQINDLGTSYKDGSKGTRAVWALDAAYGSKLVNRLDSYVSSYRTDGGSSVAVSTKKFRKQLVGYQANCPNIKLNVGPGQLEGITHNTDNLSVGANAQMHRDFVANGGGQYNVSYHATADSKEIIQILELDRVAYQASDGCDNRDVDEGCFWGIAIEGCMNADGDIDLTFENVAYWMAMVEAGDPRIDYGTMPKEYFKGFISRTIGHQKVSFDQKYCPRAFLDKWGQGYEIRLAQRANFYLQEMNVPEVPAELFRGLTHGDLAAVFGVIDSFKYDPNGPLSTLFRERWVKEGRIAPMIRAIQRQNDRLFVFSDGWTVQAIGSKLTELSDRDN